MLCWATRRSEDTTLEMDPRKVVPILEAGTEARAPDSETVTASSEAVTAGPETVSAGLEAEIASLEAHAGSEAESAVADADDYRYRLMVILKELIQFFKKNLSEWSVHEHRLHLRLGNYPTQQIISSNPGFGDISYDPCYDCDFISFILSQGVPEDPITDSQTATLSQGLQNSLKIIRGFEAESPETAVMMRMALLTAATCYEAKMSRHTRHMDMRPLTHHALDEPLLHILLGYVVVRREHSELFKKFLENHGRFMDLNCLNSKGVTPLYVAIKDNNLEMVKAFTEVGANYLKVSQENDSALHAAVNNPIILKYLAENCLIPNSGSYNNNGYTPMHMAVISKQLQQLELLTDADSSYLYDITQKEKKTCLHLAVENESVEIVEAIFKRLERKFDCREYSKYIITNQLDKNGNTPFHAALQGKNKDIIEIFLRNGAILSEKRKTDGSTALEIIATHFNDASNIICNAFDDSISISTDTGENTIDYSSFPGVNDTNQINVIEEIIQSGQSNLLLHPLIKSYVYLKWNYFLPLFYIMISVHAIFLITFNVLVANIFYYRDTVNSTVSANQTDAAPWLQLYGWRYWALIGLMYSIITVLIAQESFTIYIKREQWRHHFAQMETWMRLVFLVLAIFLPVVLACADPADWQRHAACAALLLGWLQAMFLLSRFPSWGSYVLMFGRVAFNLLKILASMLFLIIGFSFCFMIQYRSTPPFDGPVAAFFKTLVMMSSEFDYEDLFGEDHDKELRDTIVTVRLLFGLFVIFVAIALMNFMTGAAVSDINELTLMADKRRLEKQVQLLSTIEAIVYDGALSRVLRKVFRRGRYYKNITYSTTKVTKWKVIHVNEVETYNDCFDKLAYINRTKPNELTEQLFEVRPSHKLNEGFDKIIRKKEWREEKRNAFITKYKVEELHDALIHKPKEGEEEGNKDWVRGVISKQGERMESLAEDLLQVSQANEEMKRFIEDMNTKIEKLISNQTQVSQANEQMKRFIEELISNQTQTMSNYIKELTSEMKKMAK